jgi:hypothetical protein
MSLTATSFLGMPDETVLVQIAPDSSLQRAPLDPVNLHSDSYRTHTLESVEPKIGELA